MPVADILQALDSEIAAVRSKYRQNPIVVTPIKSTFADGIYMYEGAVTSLEEGDVLSIPEGVSIRVIHSVWDPILRMFEPIYFDGKLLYYDSNSHHIIISIPGKHVDLGNRSYRIQPTVEELLRILKDKIQSLYIRGYRLSLSILSNRSFDDLYPLSLDESAGQNLNSSQKAVLEKVFSHDITYLWGPPGTGKTTTLATIIHELLACNQRVLALSTSNIAVDQMALKFIQKDEYENVRAGVAVRFGYTRLKEVRIQDKLFPQRDHISALRNRISKIEESIQNQKDPLLRAQLTNRIAELQLELKNAIIEPLKSARVVFTTATQAILVPEFADINFDVVIVDEVSMVSIAMVLYLSSLAKKKIILSGDFMQLQPIALSKTPESIVWLHRDAFRHSDIDKNQNHPRLGMLIQQHRMCEEISTFISKSFYFNKLTTCIKDENKLGAMYPPSPNDPIVFISYTVEDGNSVQKTESFSRYNLGSSNIVFERVKKIVRSKGRPSIGVITPYAAQAQRIKRMVKEASQTDVNPKWADVRVGTVHSFQGHESDIIIFDLVDEHRTSPGKLYSGTTGTFLLNVAISRAKGKVIIVGDPELFSLVRTEDFPVKTSFQRLLESAEILYVNNPE